MDQLYIICGSGSHQRYTSIQNLGNVKECIVIKPDIDEQSLGASFRQQQDPQKHWCQSLVVTLGKKKAQWILEYLNQHPLPQEKRDNDWIIVTGDQVIVYNNKILEKPSTEMEFYAFFKMYNEYDSDQRLRPLHTVGSVVLTHVKTNTQIWVIDTAELCFTSPISLESLSPLLGPAMNAAGGLLIEHPLILPYVKIISGTIETIQGLDTTTLKRLLLELRQKINPIYS